MLIYIHEHYPENLSVKELAAAAYTVNESAIAFS